MGRAILTFLIAVAVASVANAATYYVTKAGNDATGTGSISKPWLTINKGCQSMAGGDTLLVGDGTYTEGLNNVIKPGKGSWTTATKIQAINRRKAIIRPAGLNDYVLRFVDNVTKWIRVSGFVLDGINANGTIIMMPDGGAANACTNGYPQYIRIEDCEIVNMASYIHLGGAFSTCPKNLHSIGHEFVDCDVHNNRGELATTAFAFYLCTRNCVIRGCSIYDNNGFGISMHTSGSTPRNNIIENNRIYHNGLRTDIVNASGIGILLSNADSIIIRNNLIYNNQIGSGIKASSGSLTNSAIYNNTIVGNAHDGINLTFAGSTNNVVRNNIVFGNSMGSINVASGNTVDHNITTNPLFVDTAARDFHLKSTSIAIDSGYDLSGIVDEDFEGMARPYGGSWDVGAYEYKPASAINHVFPATPNQSAHSQSGKILPGSIC